MRPASPIGVALLLAAWCLAAPSPWAQEPANVQESASAKACITCHVKPAERAAASYRIFDETRWAESVHATLECILCHKGADPKAFDQVPHRLGDPPRPCMHCHGHDFPEIGEEVQRSVHAAQPEAFTCGECHSPHYMRIDLAALPRAERVHRANGPCIECHDEKAVLASGREGARGLREAHAWDPARNAHARMRCVVCHTPIDGSLTHELVPREESIRSCDACHDVNAPIIAKYAPVFAEYAGEDDPSTWVTNPIIFEEAYVPGATRHLAVDGVLKWLFWLTVAGALVHALLRVLTRRSRPRMSAAAKKVRMYPVWLRVWHWVNAVLFVVLAYTGVRMHFGQRRGPVMSFETAFNVHNLAGSLLVIAGVLYFVGNLIGRNQQQYLSRPRDGLRGAVKQARWYLFGIFKGEPHPYHASPEHKFNPLQHLTYAGVMYVLYPLLLLSGVALLFPDVLPKGILGNPGVWWVAAIHWLLAAAAILFLVGHLYLGSMGDKVRDLYAAMLDGDHRHRTREPDVDQTGGQDELAE